MVKMTEMLEDDESVEVRRAREDRQGTRRVGGKLKR
jgi:hypothetical protein